MWNVGMSKMVFIKHLHHGFHCGRRWQPQSRFLNFLQLEPILRREQFERFAKRSSLTETIYKNQEYSTGPSPSHTKTKHPLHPHIISSHCYVPQHGSQQTQQKLLHHLHEAKTRPSNLPIIQLTNMLVWHHLRPLCQPCLCIHTQQ